RLSSGIDDDVIDLNHGRRFPLIGNDGDGRGAELVAEVCAAAAGGRHFGDRVRRRLLRLHRARVEARAERIDRDDVLFESVGPLEVPRSDAGEVDGNAEGLAGRDGAAVADQRGWLADVDERGAPDDVAVARRVDPDEQDDCVLHVVSVRGTAGVELDAFTGIVELRVARRRVVVQPIDARSWRLRVDGGVDVLFGVELE